ncbi:MAG: antibiotic biosynthesis monooxygenase [Acidimicrobiia bacterium]|nr:antibiotic biosynthesis monooxygenase [Acidimicrobiia bacterium]
MSKVSMVATFSCAEGKEDEMDAVLTAQVAAAAELDGVEVYSYHRGEGNTYSFFALFSSQAAMQGHGEADSLKDVMPAFMSLLAGPPQMSVYTPIAAVGLDL